MNAGMELMGMKECRECGDPYTPAEPDTGVCSCCIMSHEVAALRARVAELERESEVVALRERDETRADAARLREALEDIARVAYRGSAAASLARAALASAPNAEPTPRDMRVAEAVRARIARHIRISPRFEGQLTTPNDNGLLGRVAQEVENLDLAAVVAKAVGT